MIMQGKVLIAQKTQLLLGLCDSVFQKQDPETRVQKPKSKVEGQCATTLIKPKMVGIQCTLVYKCIFSRYIFYENSYKLYIYI